MKVLLLIFIGFNPHPMQATIVGSFTECQEQGRQIIRQIKMEQRVNAHFECKGYEGTGWGTKSGAYP